MDQATPQTGRPGADLRLRDLLDGIAAGVPVRAPGADLARLPLGREALAAHGTAQDSAPWRDTESGGLALAGADLARARLEEADLTGANLRRASLSGINGRSTRFAGAILEEADLTEADLSGADFTGVVAGQVRLSEAMLEDARFTDAAMRFADLSRALLDGASFRNADLWGANFTGADADDTVFRGARLDEARLADANLTHADFEGASLAKASLAGSRLRGATFTGAKLDGADFSGADLSDANLVRLNLATCRLRHARFSGAWLNGTRMQVDQLGGAVGEEVDGAFEAAQASYLALEQNWKSIGSHDAASWAYKRGRRMGRFHAGALARAALAARDGRGVVRHGYRWCADRFVEWLCDYGESLSRIARAFFVLIGVFAVLYGLTSGMIILEGAEAGPTHNPMDLLSYSALNMMTANPPEIGLKPTGRVTNLLVGIQGAVGIILMGLFGFVLGNRLRR
ncbi:pentapeptide repeat-containing protein [Methylobacterium sp. NEAU 140]|uniref:pentapeptide repeat-containing protein n=1 Tax=Methylobacterium sp. NEAU 140 TaxID=3064945 RepID=UPI002732BD4E|nr:pentapeptide repeat-containing protein [Methylobacterium sp. NEAU 140]MDP4023450.1 pentapeptide repeat-containing protein [Methylobacterium sp. NEAU 140]